jgi:hypothetical protein
MVLDNLKPCTKPGMGESKRRPSASDRGPVIFKCVAELRPHLWLHGSPLSPTTELFIAIYIHRARLSRQTRPLQPPGQHTQWRSPRPSPWFTPSYSELRGISRVSSTRAQGRRLPRQRALTIRPPSLPPQQRDRLRGARLQHIQEHREAFGRGPARLGAVLVSRRQLRPTPCPWPVLRARSHTLLLPLRRVILSAFVCTEWLVDFLLCWCAGGQRAVHASRGAPARAAQQPP